MTLDEARERAVRLVESMRPYAERVEIAGSIRRRKNQVRDIEIVAIPRCVTVPDPSDLFGESTATANLLYEQWHPPVEWVKGRSPEGRYWQGRLECGAQLDLFLARPDNWGIILAIRTGSAEFSQALVTHAKRIGRPSREGYLRGRDGTPLPTPTERDVFDLLGLAWVEPWLRWDARAVRSKWS